ncbi:ABC-type transport auxiliary lipoprotein family protein [Novosphingobium album (ex Liu et al. 2023)]|uniref:ABC-type transport auxiliary lipoprotein family protein n=1 Tax=Novosphingobium album (ex Liu et al. 2023) TaxID=3031130 RepID=A0ABT5WTB5_9SPHN|nr:ABC-type transport auxiliary lipoprotein family protein [Novosphingobium album (ex Liu et al. 2023)]MDE8652633.1 ABC-type transport auxiliary lipoprotein family protein [Novosphingobium album (ex Liu et al. 2023)]
MPRTIGWKSAAFAVACLTLAGCVSLGGKTPDLLLRLTAENRADAGTESGGRLADAIVVYDPAADRRLDVLRVPVQVDASSVAYLKDASWVEKPARQFRGLLAETLRAKSQRLVVEGGDVEVSGKPQTLGGRLLDMGYDARDQSVIVRFDAVLEAGDGMSRIKRFEARVPGVAAEAAAVGPALNRAANDVAVQVAAWVAP